MKSEALPFTLASVRSVDGTVIATELAGQGPALVIITGAAQRGRHYAELGRALAHRFTVVLYDRRGRGRSGSGSVGVHDGVAAEVADLCAVVDATGARLAFGHSAGGMVALEAARAQPSLFSRIAVYEPGVLLADLAAAGVFATAWLEPFERALAAGKAGRAFSLFVDALALAPPGAMPRPLFHLVVRALLHTPAGAELKALLATVPRDLRMALALTGGAARYHAVAAPTLVLAGDRSAPFLVAAAAAAARALPDARHHVVAGADHIAPLVRARSVAPLLASFLGAPPAHAPIPNAGYSHDVRGDDRSEAVGSRP
ncbi:MAG TPA: alpha/beta hydrolase [Myxococcota bacterium]